MLTKQNEYEVNNNLELYFTQTVDQGRVRMQPLVVMYDTLVFTANVLAWTSVTVAEVVYTGLYGLFALLSRFAVVAVPVLGKVLEGTFYGALQVLEVLLNVSII